MKKLDGKVVRFIAVDPKYARTPYPSKPAFSQSMGTWVTGQHIDPKDKDTHGNLSREEMEKPDKLTVAKKKKFPYVINPENGVPIKHSTPYDCRVDEKGNPLNPVQYAEAHYILLQDIVAPNKHVVRKNKHKFYLDDKEAEALYVINDSDVKYEAEKIIREEFNVSEYSEVIEILNNELDGFHQASEGLSDNQMKAILIKLAKDNPKAIVKMYGQDFDTKRTIARLLKNGILERASDGYWDGDVYIGSTFYEVMKFIKDGRSKDRVAKWMRLLAEYAQTEI